MDPNLHLKQGLNLVNRVLQYASFVQEGDEALVGLTTEDWYVVADLLFHTELAEDVLPEQIRGYQLSPDQKHIELQTPDVRIKIERT